MASIAWRLVWMPLFTIAEVVGDAVSRQRFLQGQRGLDWRQAQETVLHKQSDDSAVFCHSWAWLQTQRNDLHTNALGRLVEQGITWPYHNWHTTSHQLTWWDSLWICRDSNHSLHLTGHPWRIFHRLKRWTLEKLYLFPDVDV